MLNSEDISFIQQPLKLSKDRIDHILLCRRPKPFAVAMSPLLQISLRFYRRHRRAFATGLLAKLMLVLSEVIGFMAMLPIRRATQEPSGDYYSIDRFRR